MYGRNDRAEGFALQPDGSFYVDGSFDVKLPSGEYRLALSKGYEFLQQTDTLAIRGNEVISRSYALRRWIDMPERGWYSIASGR